MDFERLVEIVKLTRFDNKPSEVIYYANGDYLNKNFMWYVYDGYKAVWVQSGYKSVDQLKQFKDFQERLNERY